MYAQGRIQEFLKAGGGAGGRSFQTDKQKKPNLPRGVSGSLKRQVCRDLQRGGG